MTVEIVAEIGINHNNDLQQAAALIIAARDAGATVVKFQASTVSEEVSARAAPEHYAMLRSVVPTFAFLEECVKLCAAAGVEFLCTPAGLESLEWVLRLGVKRIKVASDNLTNIPFLLEAEAAKLRLILSTGMSTADEIAEVIAGLNWNDHLTVLHCGSAYPLPIEDANLRSIPALAAKLALPVGWSDHTTSTTLAAVAVGLGAVMIEKHITLDRSAPGPDHRASLEPWQFKAMVENIREAEAALGDGVKRIMPSERDNRSLVGKSLVASAAIRKGEAFTTENLAVKRPGNGISPLRYFVTLRKKASRDYAEGELITDRFGDR